MLETEEKTTFDQDQPSTTDEPELLVETADELEQEVDDGETASEGYDEKRKSLLSGPLVLLIVGLLVGGLGGFYLRPVVIPDPEPVEAAPLAMVEDSGQINEPDPHQAVMLAVISGARHFYGDPNAPVTLVEFGDFNCGYCGRWAKETLPLIDETYIKTGKVRMAYVHFPILGADSMTAAEGTECAAQQDKFWEYHNIVYAHQGIGFTPDNLTALADQLELDTAAFESCLANFPERVSLEEDIRLAQIMGVRGTPAFLVNGVPLAGAYPYDDFVRVIEGALNGEF